MAFILLVGCVLYSCKNENVSKLESRNSAAIDSIVNARLVPVRNDLLAGCQASVDSMIVAEADAILLASETKTLVPVTKPKTSKPKPKAPVKPTPVDRSAKTKKIEPAVNIKKPIKKAGNTGKKQSGTKVGSNTGKKKSGTTSGRNTGKKKKSTTP